MNTIDRILRQCLGSALVAGLLALSGCGPTTVGTCQKGCTKTFTCLGGTQGQILDCQNKCSTNTNEISGCVNAGDILACFDSCYDKACNEVLGCVAGCPKCVK